MVKFGGQIGRMRITHPVTVRTGTQLYDENNEKLLLISTQIHVFIMNDCKYIYDFSKLIKMDVFHCSTL